MKDEITEELYVSEFGYEVAIEEMKFRLEEQYNSIETMKSFVRHIFGAGSLIIGLIGTLQIIGVEVDPKYHCLYNFLILLTMILYFILIATSVWALSPLKVKGPTPADWDMLHDHLIWHEDKFDIYRQRLSNYLNAIDINEPIIDGLYKRVNVQKFLLPAIVLILLGLSLIPRTPIP